MREPAEPICLTPWDGLAWALMSPSLVMVLLALPVGPGLLSRFAAMFTSLDAELPLITQAMIAIGDPWVYVIAVAWVTAGTGALLRVRDTGLRVGLGIGFAVAALIWLQMVAAAICLPILELQKQLH